MTANPFAEATARAMLETLHEALPDRYDRSSLRTGGLGSTGGGGHGLFEAFVQRIGVKHGYEPYGMTEVNAMAMFHHLDEPLELRKLPGIHPAPGLEVRVAHPENGAVCEPGEEGELQFRGPRVTRGYYKRPEDTAAAFTADGWFRSGDLGVQTEDGHTIFKGRLRETLPISHFMVAPGEIEAFLKSHPDSRAGVRGRRPRRKGQRGARRVRHRGRRRGLTEDDLRTFCRGQIASYKIPIAIRFVRDVPRTPGPHGDKVQRAKLREQAIKELHP